MSALTPLAILTAAARYDVACASSGSTPRRARGKGIGSTASWGVCHSFTPDGRCVSLFKVLLTNRCRYDCRYCANRRSSDTPRAGFAVRELVDLTLAFYRRNYIEGLFLSSAVPDSPDRTMERMLRVVRTLRRDEDFGGYIHLKVVPGASPELLEAAGRWTDRLSVNIEAPTAKALAHLAPEKDQSTMRRAMHAMSEHIAEARTEPRAPRFSPGGQATQMVIGAEASDDGCILRSAYGLYNSYGLKRVYYSGYSPVSGADGLPAAPPPKLREHRLYQADWLLRFYGYSVGEILSVAPGNMLDLHVEPKLAWALTHRHVFPMDVNRAEREQLLRIPGLGVRTVETLLNVRRLHALRVEDLARLRVSLAKVLPFVVLIDHHPGRMLDAESLRRRFLRRETQLPLPLVDPERNEEALCAA